MAFACKQVQCPQRTDTLLSRSCGHSGDPVSAIPSLTVRKSPPECPQTADVPVLPVGTLKSATMDLAVDPSSMAACQRRPRWLSRGSTSKVDGHQELQKVAVSIPGPNRETDAAKLPLPGLRGGRPNGAGGDECIGSVRSSCTKHARASGKEGGRRRPSAHKPHGASDRKKMWQREKSSGTCCA